MFFNSQTKHAAVELCFSAKSMSPLILMNIISSIHSLTQKEPPNNHQFVRGYKGPV